MNVSVIGRKPLLYFSFLQSIKDWHWVVVVVCLLGGLQCDYVLLPLHMINVSHRNAVKIISEIYWAHCCGNKTKQTQNPDLVHCTTISWCNGNKSDLWDIFTKNGTFALRIDSSVVFIRIVRQKNKITYSFSINLWVGFVSDSSCLFSHFVWYYHTLFRTISCFRLIMHITVRTFFLLLSLLCKSSVWKRVGKWWADVSC